MAVRTPKFPFPIHVNIFNFVTIKLSEDNFLLWQAQFSRFLRSQGLFGFVNGEITAPPTTVQTDVNGTNVESDNPDYTEWLRTDQLVSSWVSGAVSETILSLIIGLDTAYEVWETLLHRFAQKSVSREFELRGKLQSCLKRDRTLLVYIREHKSLCDQLSAIGKPVDDITKMFGVLEGLGPEYESFRTTMYCVKPQPEYDEMISQLERFDARLQLYSPASYSPNLAYYGQRKPGVSSNSTFPSQQIGPRGGRGFGRARSTPSYRARGYGYSGRNSTFRSSTDFVPSSPDHQYRKPSDWPSTGQGFRPYANSTSRYQGVNSFPSSSQGSNLSSPYDKSSPNSPLICQICKRPGHDALRCWYRFDNAYQTEDIPVALTALHLEDPLGNEWYPDTGASAHITAASGTLTNPLLYSGCDTVMIGNGSCLPIVSTGDTVLHTQTRTLPLRDVLVVPEIKKNLLSVSKLTQDYPCSLIFDNIGVYLKDQLTHQVVQIGRKHQGLYRVEAFSPQAYFAQSQQAVGHALWHQRLAHTNYNTLKYLRANNFIQFHGQASVLCESCQLSKSSALPFSLSDSRATSPLFKIHCDVWGPSPVSSFQNFRYYVVFIDDFSRYSWLYPMKKKSEVYDIFVMFQKLVENQLDQKIKIFQCDGGGEFTSTRFQKHLQDCGIKQQFSCPYTPEQNGIAERKHRHVVELALAMIFHATVPLSYWVDAFLTATYIINLLPTSTLAMQSPSSTLYKQQPDLTHLRVFGCRCFPCLRPYSPHKLAPRSLPCVFLGYSLRHKGYRCLLPSTGRIYVSRHVIFDEGIYPFAHGSTSSPSSYPDVCTTWQAAARSVSQDPTTVSPPTAPAVSQDVPYPVVYSSRDAARSAISQAPPIVSLTDPLPGNPHSPPSTSDSSLLISPSISVPLSSPTASEVSTIAAPPVVGPAHPMQTRYKSGIVKPNPRYACLVQYSVPPEPKSVKTALADPGWFAAMREELDALAHNNTWSLVPRTSSMNVIGSKWVFKTKLASDGSLERLKARLVAKGFHQEEGIDYTETFSPVIKHATIRLVLSVALTKNWPVHQFDVKNAFLHGNLAEQVYMEQPPGFINNPTSDHVCLLHKSLYGLRQAPRAWFEKFSNFLLEFGFFCSSSDPSLFVLHNGSATLILLLYVDDILLTGSSSSLLASLVQSLHSHFHMKDLGRLHYFLGIEATYSSKHLSLCQTKYAYDLLTKAHMADCKPISTPLALRSPDSSHDVVSLSNPFEYRSLVGGLQYLTLTRPDIAYATNLLCQKLQAPTVGDFHRLKRVLRYVKGTLHLGLLLHAQSSLSLSGFSDADWAGCSTTRRSTTGFCTYLGSNLISWSAKRQTTVSRSSTEAEYRALASATAELTWLSFVLRDIGVSLSAPTPLFCDNKSAIALSANPILHARTKHIEVDFHFVREKVSAGSVVIQYVPSPSQLADLFTKPLTRVTHCHLRTKLGLSLRPRPTLRGADKIKAQAGEKAQADAETAQADTVAAQAKTQANIAARRCTTDTVHNSTCPVVTGPLELKNRYSSLSILTE